MICATEYNMGWHEGLHSLALMTHIIISPPDNYMGN